MSLVIPLGKLCLRGCCEYSKASFCDITNCLSQLNSDLELPANRLHVRAIQKSLIGNNIYAWIEIEMHVRHSHLGFQLMENYSKIDKERLWSVFYLSWMWMCILTKYHMLAHFGSFSNDVSDLRGFSRVKSRFCRDFACCCFDQATRASSLSRLWWWCEGSIDRFATVLCSKW